MSESSSSNLDEQLLKACINQEFETVSKLLAEGATFQVVDSRLTEKKKFTKLVIALMVGMDSISFHIMEISEAGIKVINSQTNDSYFYGFNGHQTPSHIALNNKRLKTYHMLKLAGADLTIKDSRGYSVLDFSEVKKQETALNFLQKLHQENKYEIYRDISLGFLSEDVYDIHSHLPPLSWKLLVNVDHKKEDLILNYYGAAYFDENTKTLAIVHRGTNLNSNNIQTNIQLFTGILKGEMPTAQYYSCMFSDYVIELLTGESQKSSEKLFKILSKSTQEFLNSKELLMKDLCIVDEMLIKKYKNEVKEICHSGHSLGGAHSQFCAFFDGHNSITFDNPPNRHMIESICLTANYEDKDVLIQRLYENSKCYFGPPNYINGFSFYGDDDKMMKAFAQISHISHDCIFVEKGAHITDEKVEDVKSQNETTDFYLEILKWMKTIAVFAYNQYISHSIERINDKISVESFWDKCVKL